MEIEKNKSSVIVRKPCLTLELLELQGRLGRRTSLIFELMKNKGSCKFVPVKLKLWSKAAEDKLTLDQGGLLPLGHQKWDKTSKSRSADDPKFFCWWGSVPRNLWLPSLQRRQELLSSAVECVQRQCTCTCCYSYVPSCTLWI